MSDDENDRRPASEDWYAPNMAVARIEHGISPPRRVPESDDDDHASPSNGDSDSDDGGGVARAMREYRAARSSASASAAAATVHHHHKRPRDVGGGGGGGGGGRGDDDDETALRSKRKKPSSSAAAAATAAAVVAAASSSAASSHFDEKHAAEELLRSRLLNGYSAPAAADTAADTAAAASAPPPPPRVSATHPPMPAAVMAENRIDHQPFEEMTEEERKLYEASNLPSVLRAANAVGPPGTVGITTKFVPLKENRWFTSTDDDGECSSDGSCFACNFTASEKSKSIGLGYTDMLSRKFRERARQKGVHSAALLVQDTYNREFRNGLKGRPEWRTDVIARHYIYREQNPDTEEYMKLRNLGLIANLLLRSSICQQNIETHAETANTKGVDQLLKVYKYMGQLTNRK